MSRRKVFAALFIVAGILFFAIPIVYHYTGMRETEKLAFSLDVSTDYLLFGETYNQIDCRELASIINGLSTEDVIKAKNVLTAVFT